jgi:vacuolar-type H+-ATPase subunit H
MKQAVKIALTALFLMTLVGCASNPFAQIREVKDDVKERIADAREKLQEEAREMATEMVAKAKEEIVSVATEEAVKVANQVVEEGLKDLEKKHHEANEIVANDLGIDKEVFDINKDGHLEPNEQKALALEIFKRGREKNLPMTTILFLIIFVVFYDDIKKFIKDKTDKGVRKLSGGK